MMSETNTESHYPRTHLKNKDCQVWDEIKLDVGWNDEHNDVNLQEVYGDRAPNVDYMIDLVINFKMFGLRVHWEVLWKKPDEAKVVLRRAGTTIAAGFDMGAM